MTGEERQILFWVALAFVGLLLLLIALLWRPR